MSNARGVRSVTEHDNDLLRSLYDHLRTARLSARYYEHRLWLVNKCHLFFEIAIAVGATSSGVAGWALLERSQLRVALGRDYGACHIACDYKANPRTS